MTLPAHRTARDADRVNGPGIREPILAFDTSGGLGSVALQVDGRRLVRRFLPERGRQAALLVPGIREAMEEAGVRPRELGGLVVGRGPGSFTGVRIAAATARGLAHALGIPLWTFSSLAAGAASHGVAPGGWEAWSSQPGNPAAGRSETILELSEEAARWPRFVLFDARGERLYGGCWRFAPAGAEMAEMEGTGVEGASVTGAGVEEIFSPMALTVDAFLDLDLPPRLLLCGDGAHRHAEILEAHDHRILPYPAGLPLAEGLLRLLALHGDRRPEPAGSRWEPDYLRPSQPEREAAPHASGDPGR
jgi:tRNA threonylcarbamoyl adenosine modification protein YeaZ